MTSSLLGADLLSPLSGAHPAGSSLRYDPVYDRIRRAREEEADVPQGEWRTQRKVADYNTVVALASEVLAKRSKDLQVAAWLTEALLCRNGAAGLREGLDLIRALLERFWDHVHPEIDEEGDLETRAAPLGWIGRGLVVPVGSLAVNGSGHTCREYLASRKVPTEEDAEQDGARAAAREEAISEGKLTPEAFDEAFAATSATWYQTLVADLDDAIGALQALEAVVDERFGAGAPSLIPLRDALAQVRQVAGQLLDRKRATEPEASREASVPEPAMSPETAPKPSASAAAAAPDGGAERTVEEAPEHAAPRGSAPGPAVSASQVGVFAPEPASRDDAAARITSAAHFLRAADPTDPTPYLVVRGFRWGELRAGGGSVDPWLLDAPSTEIRTAVRTRLLGRDWAGLLEAAEEAMATPAGRGWLDLQRYVDTACEALGGRYAAVANAVRSALGALLRDLPQLPALTLMDDSPTANRETQQWLQQEFGMPDASAASADSPRAASMLAGSGAPRGVLERAVAEVRAGAPERAVDLLVREAAAEPSARARFLLRTEAARILVDHGFERVALPILRELHEQVAQHRLEEWEDGATVARTLGLLVRCVRALDGEADEANGLYLRICRLDPMQALALAPQPSHADAHD
jgi:type VI secretion system protein ImpA